MNEPPVVLTATYRVVTPMFLSGADQSTAELRLPSFKGALRFWWRALATERDIGKLRDEEDRLFGSTRGASKVRMRIRPCDAIRIAKKGSVLSDNEQGVVGEGARYLGYGVMEAFASQKKGTKAGQLTRACLQAPFTFSVELRAYDLDAAQKESLLQALKALGTMGALGSKARKGYGSLILQELKQGNQTVWAAPATVHELVHVIESFYANAAYRTIGLPAYTALSGLSRHVVMSANKKSPLALLDLVGREMVRYRSWGHNGKVLGASSEKNFKQDHDLMKKQAADRQMHPQRIAFGLPHNYGKREQDQVPPSSQSGNAINRRASPLFIHIHEVGDDAVAVLSFLPADFLPNVDHARVNVGGQKVAITPHPEIWQPIEGFLDRLATGKGRKEPFTTVSEARV